MKNSQRASKGTHTGKETESDRRSRLHDWTTQAKELLAELAKLLGDTTECWEQFRDSAAHYFDDLDEEAEKAAYMDNLGNAFYALEKCRKELVGLQRRCDQFSRHVSRCWTCPLRSR